MRGYWRLSNLTTHVKRCDWAADDDPDKTPCKGGHVGALCVDAGGEYGPLCRLCPEGTATSLGSYYTEGRCVECPPPSSSAGLIMAIVAAIAVVAAIIAYIYYHPR